LFVHNIGPRIKEENVQRFSACSKNAVLQDLLKSGVNCSIPLTSSWFPLNECSTDPEAGAVLAQVIQSLIKFHNDPGHLGCPAPCTSTSFKLGVSYAHESSLYLYNTSVAIPGYFRFFFRFDNLNTEQIIENFEYDLVPIL
jgi:hypothetical protein